MVKYIRQCIESVVHQSLTDIEVLVIDAGSTDGTVEILEEYIHNDNRVHLIHSNKKSYGYQVNRGIELARGEYVGIVDTDDFIVPDMYENLYKTARAYDLDYCKGMAESFAEIPDFGRFTQPILVFERKENLLNRLIKPMDMPELLIKDCYLWSGIYKNEYIKKIKLNETPGAAYQDLGFIFQVYSSADRAVYIDKTVYYYRKDNLNASGYDKRAFSYLAREYEYVERLLLGKELKWKKVVYKKMLLHCHSHMNVMASGGEFWRETLPDMEVLREKIQRAEQENWISRDDIPELEERFSLFQSDIYKCYEYYKEKFDEKKYTITNILDVVKGNNVVIFGAGYLGRFIHAMMLYDQQEKVVAYCDNSIQAQRTNIQEVGVLSPEDAVRKYPDDYYIIANKKYAAEMERQLIELGITEKKILLYTVGADNLSFYRYIR